MAACFARSARLTRSAEFRRVREAGRSSFGRFIILNVLRQPGLGEARVGIITSRRVGGAVQRNRVRRRFRELVRADRDRLIRDAWLVLVARQSATRSAFSDLKAEWLRLGRQASIFAIER